MICRSRFCVLKPFVSDSNSMTEAFRRSAPFTTAWRRLTALSAALLSNNILVEIRCIHRGGLLAR